ncbi:MAG: hypothetical protein MJY70_06515, partial [Bacteroidales bacterium]|nr:hypothetical protein [Bacteroidales bacterium]
DTAKANIRAEYRAAIDTAIKTSEGKLTKALTDAITEVNGKIESLTTRVGNLETSVNNLLGRVIALEEMIQSVVIVPAYSDGSVKIANDSLYIDCIVSPSKAVANLVAGNVAVLVNKVKTKANTGVDTIKIIEGNVFEKDADKGVISVRVFIKNKIPAAGSTLTVAVNVKKDKSDFTTEFVPVTLPVSVSLDKRSIVVQSPDSDKDTTLIATVKNSTKGVSWTSSNTNIATVDNAGKVKIKANVIGKDTIVVKTVEGNATDTCFVTVLPEGALAGEFSISAIKKVYFSQGNLYWDGDSFEFETNQYDVRSSWSTSHVSHFFWSKSAEVAYAETYSESGTAGTDIFFTNATAETAKSDFTVNGVTGKYRTLSTAEWEYLFKTRTVNGGTGEGKSYQRATINSDATGNYGMILYPDNYTGTAKTSYTSAEWASLEAAGCVFLPAAGYRNGSNVNYVGEYGYYWYSSAFDDFAYSVYFFSNSVSLGCLGSRHFGYGVRLITE